MTQVPSLQDRKTESVKGSETSDFCVGEDALAEVQPLLAVIASHPMEAPDRAGGMVDADDASVMRIPVGAFGVFALIDAEDYPLVMRYRWHLSDGYVVASEGKARLRMHRLVMMVWGESEVDHKHHDKLDNRKKSLRVCSHAENMWNMRRSSRNKTGTKGVIQIGGRFLATVTRNQEVTKGWFATHAEAATWVAATRQKLHGAFARHEESPLAARGGNGA